MYKVVVLTTSLPEGRPIDFFVSLKSSLTMDETVEAVAKGAPRLTISPRPFESSSHAKLELTALGPESAPKPRLENHPSLAHSHDSDSGHTHSHENSHDHAHDHSHRGELRSRDLREPDSIPSRRKFVNFMISHRQWTSKKLHISCAQSFRSNITNAIPLLQTMFE